MKSLSRTQMLAVLSVAKVSSERDFVALQLAFGHGCRVSELVGLTPENFSCGFITIPRLKGSRKTTQTLIESAEPLLNEKASVEAWLTQCSTGQPIFGIKRSMMSKLYRRYARLAGLPEHLRNIHSAKHTTAKLSLDGGATLPAVQNYLGHKSLASTGKYLEVSDAEGSKNCQAALAA
jgi:integrase